MTPFQPMFPERTGLLASSVLLLVFMFDDMTCVYIFKTSFVADIIDASL